MLDQSLKTQLANGEQRSLHDAFLDKNSFIFITFEAAAKSFWKFMSC